MAAARKKPKAPKPYKVGATVVAIRDLSRASGRFCPDGSVGTIAEHHKGRGDADLNPSGHRYLVVWPKLGFSGWYDHEVLKDVAFGAESQPAPKSPPSRYDDGTGSDGEFFTLRFASTGKSENFTTKREAIAALDAFAAKHPGKDAEVRADRTSDGTRFVQRGKAGGRVIANYEYGTERGGRSIFIY